MRPVVLLFVLSGVMVGFGMWWTYGDQQKFTVVNESDGTVRVWGVRQACGSRFYEAERLRLGLVQPRTSRTYTERSSPVIDDDIECVYVIDSTSQFLLKEPYQDDGTYTVTNSSENLGYAPDSLQYRPLSRIGALFLAYVWPFALAFMLAVTAGLFGFLWFARWVDERRS